MSGQVFNQLDMRFLFEKQLQNSDVGQAGRIVIPKVFLSYLIFNLSRQQIKTEAYLFSILLIVASHAYYIYLTMKNRFNN